MRPPAVPLLAVALALVGCVDAPSVAVADGTLSCGSRCAVDVALASAFWEPMIAVAPDDEAHLVIAVVEMETTAGGVNRFWDRAHVSRDGGATWTPSRIPGGIDGDPSHPLATMTTLGDPTAVILRDGTLLYAGLAVHARAAFGVFGTSGQNLFVARSSDGGLTFPDVRILAEGEGSFVAMRSPAGGANLAALVQDKPWMAVGPDDEVLLVWSHDTFVSDRGSTDGELLWSITHDAGATWSEPAQAIGGPALYWGPYPVIASDGAWHVAAFKNGATPQLVLATSRDEGASWEESVVAEGVPFQFPQLAASGLPASPLLTMAYLADAGGGLSAPMLVSSADGGATWSAPLALDDRPPSTYSPEPTLALGADGTAYVTFDRAFEGGDVERRIVALRDGTIVASATLDERQPALADGDYSGLVALAGGPMASWLRADGDDYGLVASTFEWS